MCEKKCENCKLRRYAFKNGVLDACLEKGSYYDRQYHVTAGLTPMNPTRQPIEVCDNQSKFTPVEPLSTEKV